MESHSSRRQFFIRAGQMLGLVAAGPLLSRVVFAEEKRRARPAAGGAAAGGAAAPAASGGGDLSKPMVDPNSPQAKAVNYALKHADVKKAELKIERNGVPFEKQYCKDCTFYKKAGNKNGGEVGNCTVLSNNNVPHDAWCATWVKKG